MLDFIDLRIVAAAQLKMFARERGGKENLGLVIPMVIMSLLLILRFI